MVNECRLKDIEIPEDFDTAEALAVYLYLKHPTTFESARVTYEDNQASQISKLIKEALTKDLIAEKDESVGTVRSLLGGKTMRLFSVIFHQAVIGMSQSAKPIDFARFLPFPFIFRYFPLRSF